MISLRAKLMCLMVKYWLSPNLNSSMSLDGKRHFLEKLAKKSKLPKSTQTEKICTGSVNAEWISVGKTPNDSAILYFHGGGFVMGSINTHRELAAKLSEAANTRVLLFDYRLAPENPFPAALEDSISVYKWLISEGFSPEKIVFGGDSAGGGLVISTLLALKNTKEPLPAASFCISPWTDLHQSGGSFESRKNVDPLINPIVSKAMITDYAGEADLKEPLISPIFGDLRDLPPMRIHVGTDEVLYDDAVRLHDLAIKANVDCSIFVGEKMFHVWHSFAAIMPEARNAIKDLGEFARYHLQS